MESVKCLICREEFIGDKKLRAHIKRVHDISTKDYYDNYIAEDGEGACVICGALLTSFKGLIHGYNSKTCSRECRYEYRKASNLEKYGVTNPAKLASIREKIEATNLKKYGAKIASKSDAVKKNAESTNMARYGVRHTGQVRAFREKAEATSVSRYGVSIPSKSEVVKDKIASTNLLRYGTRSSFGREDVRKKSKETMIERYGVEHPMHLEAFRDKAIETCMANHGVRYSKESCELREKAYKTMDYKYGTRSHLEIPGVKEKLVATNMERYGVEHVWSSGAVRNKAKETMVAKYGVESPMDSEEIKGKAVATNIERLGVEYPMQSELVKCKSRATVLKKYGEDSVLKVTHIRAKSMKTFREGQFERHIDSLKSRRFYVEFSKDDYVNAEYGETLNYKCGMCDEVVSVVVESGKRSLVAQAITCECRGNCSLLESELSDRVAELYSGEVTLNKWFTKPGQKFELDIYVPELNLGIEFDGLYHHSDQRKLPAYHLNKTEWFKEHFNIEVIHVFENEWIEKPEIVMSIIANKLGLNKRKIFGRKTVRKDITPKQYRGFLNDNHIQGAMASSIKRGLFYGDELVAVAGFGKSRFSSDERELHRFCTKLNTQVLGGLSKLMKGMPKTYTYCDRRYFNASGYGASGFEFDSMSDIGYHYVKGQKLYSRMRFMKHKIEKLFIEGKMKSFDKKKTEKENMQDNGYHRIHDCGMIKLVYNKI